MPSFAMRLGLVVTPSRMPRSLASLIWAKLAVSMKNFMDTKLGFLLEGLGCIDTHFLHLFGCFVMAFLLRSNRTIDGCV